jgi:predicted amidophosphoribosyltransferase
MYWGVLAAFRAFQLNIGGCCAGCLHALRHPTLCIAHCCTRCLHTLAEKYLLMRRCWIKQTFLGANTAAAHV